MRDTIRQYVDAAMGALPMDRAKDLAQTLIEQLQAGRERLREVIQQEVKKQVEQLGLATKEDVDSLRERLWKLEGPKRATASTKRTTASAKRTTKKAAASTE